MKPIKFKEANGTYAENQTPYYPLPVYKQDTRRGEVTSCWKMSIAERIKILFTGKIWLIIWTFNKPLQPLKLSTKFKK